MKVIEGQADSLELRTCRPTFEVRGGKVIGWSHDGNGCYAVPRTLPESRFVPSRG